MVEGYLLLRYGGGIQKLASGFGCSKIGQ
ncbi:hypothetical protein A2U01_0047970, partial [Trifolium medium]|nr:hypothetical protein [Trifolium medium]